jgi:L-gulonolactone oxidase
MQICHPKAYIQPSTVEEIVSIVRSAGAVGTQVKVVGAGHSFSSITLTDDSEEALLLNLDNMNTVITAPVSGSSSPTVTVEAGMRVHDLNAYLLGVGYALENMGAIAVQSIAGATQTGTHGTGKGLGSMSTQIEELRLVLANSTLVVASSTQNTGIFAAARVGLGSLGIVYQMTLRVIPAFKLRRVEVPYDLGNLLSALPDLTEQYSRLQWYWTPYTTAATLLLRIPVPIDTPIGTGCWASEKDTVLSPSDKSSSTLGSSFLDAAVPSFTKGTSAFAEREHVATNVTCVDWSFKTLAHRCALDCFPSFSPPLASPPFLTFLPTKAAPSSCV